MVGEAEKKFWGCPELVDNLIPFMDFYSLFKLTQVDIPSQIPKSTPSQIPRTPSQLPNTPYPILIPVYSIIFLIQAHKPVLDIVLGRTVWSKLVKKVCEGIRNLHQEPASGTDRDRFEQGKQAGGKAREAARQVAHLVEMLKSTEEDTFDLFRWFELLLQKYLST